MRRRTTAPASGVAITTPATATCVVPQRTRPAPDRPSPAMSAPRRSPACRGDDRRCRSRADTSTSTARPSRRNTRSGRRDLVPRRLGRHVSQDGRQRVDRGRQIRCPLAYGSPWWRSPTRRRRSPTGAVRTPNAAGIGRSSADSQRGSGPDRGGGDIGVVFDADEPVGDFQIDRARPHGAVSATASRIRRAGEHGDRVGRSAPCLRRVVGLVPRGPPNPPAGAGRRTARCGLDVGQQTSAGTPAISASSAAIPSAGVCPSRSSHTAEADGFNRSTDLVRSS